MSTGFDNGINVEWLGGDSFEVTTSTDHQQTRTIMNRAEIQELFEQLLEHGFSPLAKAAE